MAEDLRRHLSGEPVQARPPGSLYRTAKFVNRHRAGVALGAALLLALILGLAGTAWQARVAAAERDRARVAAQEARRERDRARQLGAEAREVADFVVGLFRPTELERTPIQEVTAEQLLDAGAARLAGDLEDQPLTRARLMETIGAVYLDQRLLDRAEQQFSAPWRSARRLRAVTRPACCRPFTASPPPSGARFATPRPRRSWNGLSPWSAKARRSSRWPPGAA